MLNKECPICQGVKMEMIPVNFTQFKHLGFINFDKNGIICRCTNCQLLSNIVPPSREEEISDIYESKDYVQGKIANQTYLVEGYDQRVTRSFLQAEILKKYLNDTEETEILDIGCFNGALLLELSNRFPKAKFHGFDVNKNLKAVFPSKKNFYFWLSELENIERKFDLICMSHSIMYVKDISRLFKNIRRLLKPKGLLFIQINDITLNPASILLGDQYFYFTPRILKNILGKVGFDFTFLENDWFVRDAMGIARLSTENRPCQFEEDLHVYQTIDHLNEKRKKLQSIASGARLCVLGTTSIAAFVDSVLGDQSCYFVDENKNGMSSKFRDKEIVHPSVMNKSDRLIIPYGKSNGDIKERFVREYHLKHFKLI